MHYLVFFFMLLWTYATWHMIFFQQSEALNPRILRRMIVRYMCYTYWIWWRTDDITFRFRTFSFLFYSNFLDWLYLKKPSLVVFKQRRCTLCLLFFFSFLLKSVRCRYIGHDTFFNSLISWPEIIISVISAGLLVGPIGITQKTFGVETKKQR